MSQFLNIDREDAHHAYLIEGEREVLVPELLDFLESEWNFITKGNPDFWTESYDTFGIDDARAVRELQSRKPIGDKKILLIQTSFFTREAQNALLKVLEEPSDSTIFFIITQNTESLLPTLKSRLFIFPQNPQRRVLCTDKGLSFVEEFLAANPAMRTELFKDIIEEKDKNAAISFLNSLEFALHSQLGGRAPKLGKETLVFEEIQKCRSYLNDRAPSVKMILEHIALVI